MYHIMNLVQYMFHIFLFRAPARMAVRTPAPINQLFNDETIAVHILLLDILRGIRHGFDRTQD